MSKYRLTVRINVQEYHDQGYPMSGSGLNVDETVELGALDFLGIAKVLGRFHDLAQAVKTDGERPIQLDRPTLESDRFLVLLACGHWVHTLNPDAGTWLCPVLGAQSDGQQPATITDDGKPAILGSWDLSEANTDD